MTLWENGFLARSWLTKLNRSNIICLKCGGDGCNPISYPFNLSIFFMGKGGMGNPSEWQMKLLLTISPPKKAN